MAAFWIDCEEIANSQKIIKIKLILQFFDKSLFLVTVSNGLTDSIKDFCTCKITHAYNLCSNQHKKIVILSREFFTVPLFFYKLYLHEFSKTAFWKNAKSHSRTKISKYSIIACFCLRCPNMSTSGYMGGVQKYPLFSILCLKNSTK